MSRERCSVLVGIVTYNRLHKLVKGLEEFRRLGYTHFVIVDNGSEDGTREYLARQEGLHCIFTDKNEGGSGGFNRIMRYFVEEKAHAWLLMVDDDAYPAFSLEELESYLSSKTHTLIPGYCFRVSYPDGTLCEMNRPGINPLAGNPVKAMVADFHVDSATAECEVDFAGFVGLLLRRETIEQVGVVSKSFFIYSDDTYYTLSISRKVGPLRYCPKLVLIHDCNRSSRHFAHHDRVRLEKDVVNKIVLIREYSRYAAVYLGMYVARLLLKNPRRCADIINAARKGLAADLRVYRNESL